MYYYWQYLIECVIIKIPVPSEYRGCFLSHPDICRMITADDLQEFSDNDRFGLTLFLSLLLHLILVLGTSFTIWQNHRQTSLPALDIVLVNSRSSLAPKKADFLAPHRHPRLIVRQPHHPVLLAENCPPLSSCKLANKSKKTNKGTLRQTSNIPALNSRKPHILKPNSISFGKRIKNVLAANTSAHARVNTSMPPIWKPGD